ncbi:transmembrane anterior posterior transformation protein 1-like [Rhopilema esculentum]|uniref:transmembrane anterior posterior transformation protein 1-like n=1 Tax=Rhopilema esculentum TaxID=499914 RepID=UPI0031E451CB
MQKEVEITCRTDWNNMAVDSVGVEENSDTPKKSSSLFSYIIDEVKRDYLLEYNEQKLRERRKRVYTFMKTPRELEKFMVFGILLCVDVFLFIFTFLPIRAFLAICTFIVRVLKCRRRTSFLEPVQKVDLLKAIIMICCTFGMMQIDTSVLYHIVRGQSVIKLYVVYNMLDIADKLLASFGQDVLDALYWTATEPKGRKREHVGIIPHLALSLVYVYLHSLLNLCQAIVLNVALNSFNKALLTIMISNQFVEIKGSVFKRVEKNNLFQISCSDARERFHYVNLILIVFMRNMTEFNWDVEYIWNFIPAAGLVMGSEFLVDWFKHAFITKFNDIKPEVYETYRASLAHNIVMNRHESLFTGHTDQVSRKMGFSPLPMACLIIRVFSQSLELNGWPGFVLFLVMFLCLCALKLLVSIHIYGEAAVYIQVLKPSPTKEKFGKTSFRSANTVQDIITEADSNSSIVNDVTSTTEPKKDI